MARSGGLARLVCGRRTKWIVLAFWAAVIFFMGPLAGKLTGVEKNDNSAWLPGGAEATQVIDLAARFQSQVGDVITALLQAALVELP